MTRQADMDEKDDAVFAAQCLKALPSISVPPSLEMRILGDFDRLAPRRRTLRAFALHWAEGLWPGAPLWQPLAALALSLLIGLAAGNFVPASTQLSTTDLTIADTGSVMDLYKDL